jgi:hypothetical protein
MRPDSIITVESCLDEAQGLVQQLQYRLNNDRERRWRSAFTALAGHDQALGLLAFYIWRRRVRRQM